MAFKNGAACLALIVLQLFLIKAQASPKPQLKGVTVLSQPYVYKSAEQEVFTGYAVELLDKIAEKAGFAYQLYLAPDGMYGREVNGKIKGMIGEVAEKKADFAIADLRVTDERKRHVAFTEPFLSDGLAALIHKEDAAGVNSIEDLVNRNEQAAKSGGQQIGYLILEHGSLQDALSKTENPVGKRINDWVDANKDKALVRSLHDTNERIARAPKHGAHITTALSAEYVSSYNCNLKMLPDTGNIYAVDYAIALPKDSPHLEKFNQAIRELKQDGTIKRLKDKFWASICI